MTKRQLKLPTGGDIDTKLIRAAYNVAKKGAQIVDKKINESSRRKK